jgi:hypothetical protein
MNESWGYNPRDPFYKSARFLINTLQEVASKGGNLLLNVSPMADGTIPAEQVERLDAIGAWTARNGESVAEALPGLERLAVLWTLDAARRGRRRIARAYACRRYCGGESQNSRHLGAFEVFSRHRPQGRSARGRNSLDSRVARYSLLDALALSTHGAQFAL